MNRTGTRFSIRAELPDGQCHDFEVHATSRGQTPAFRVAREAARTHLDTWYNLSTTAQLEWRGMVVFVNRPVPLG